MFPGVTGITSDSRKVIPGSVFFALKGDSSDGHDYVDAAVKKGAQVIVSERAVNVSVESVVREDARDFLGKACSEFLGFPSDQMKVIGVTGTSGKTTVSFLIEAILKEAGLNPCVLGTLNYRMGDQVFPAEHTTPPADVLQETLALFQKKGAQACVMEVSSHALKQARASGVSFDVGVFTNLSPEHLDYHLDLDDYFSAKRLLFTDCFEYSRSRGKSPIGIVHGGDSYGKQLLKQIQARDFFSGMKNLRVSAMGVAGNFSGIDIESLLLGSFNAENISAAVMAAQAVGVEESAIKKGIEVVKSLPGRLEQVPNSRGIMVVVDYAHKPEALEKVLETLRSLKPNRLLCVFGCGGDRDRKKRPAMGRIATENADLVFVTSDNPRTEDPAKIIDEILKGTTKDVHTEPDRKRAIATAIETAQEGDCILIAGKGHEDYQIVGKQKRHFDDREVAREFLAT